MAIDRRTLLGATAGSLAAVVAGRALADEASEIVVGCCREPSGAFAVIAYDRDAKRVVKRVGLAARGHDLAVRPGTSECVVFARRPGVDALAFSADGSRPATPFHTAADRHFYGHGVFSPDGRVLYSTEASLSDDGGRIGVRDATAGYRQIGEFMTGGIGPHDLALVADGRTLVVANGGIATDGGRVPLNLGSMQPSLAYVDTSTGDVLETHELAVDLRQLSIRHLAVGVRDTVIVGCQYEGQDGREAPLVLSHRRGEVLRPVGDDGERFRVLKNYIGSVAADAAGEYAVASAPRSGLALLIDVAAGRVVGERELPDVCGVTGRHRGAGFILTSGFGDVAQWTGSADLSEQSRVQIAWDNHAVAL